ncbi:putative methyltransferase NSUN7 isoform X2 [Dicentrarchus labrax]|uniref:putative methyltransferase NSUN7 isoform X2 n=1 Tax=Dicentrarchus labrax TaxID=13489 RepID=UPI0021F4FED8|nr:putative methyltransferase NSUN7 isoform X2 [Dicentrarchus labrax]
MADKVGSSKDVNTSSVTEQIFISPEDHSQPTNKEPLSFLPPLPHLSSLPSPVSPPSNQAYLQAAAIFQKLRTEKPVTQQLLHYGKKTDTSLPESGDKPTQRQAYQLAFSTLKYQDLLEDVITDSCFHTSQHISSDLLPLAMVMLFDFQDRRFLSHERSSKEAEEPLQEVRDLQGSLQRCKTKLAASLARCRVKQNLQSVSCFLSDAVRTKQHRAKCLPLYAWVNTLKTSVEEVCEVLQSAGLSEVENMTDLRESTFCRDPLCPDTLVFSKQLHALLRHSSLAITHVLNSQDRSVCVAVSVLRPLLFENGDVLVVGSFSAVTVAHISIVAAARSGRVLVCGADHTPLQIEEIQELLSQMDIKNVRVLSEAFCGLDEWDQAVQRLKVIIVLPQCSSSALNDPVPTIHSEHGDWDLLPDLSHGCVSLSKIHTMATQQARLLAHALSFPKVQTVVYCTRSVYPEENEQLVKRVLEKTHTHPKLLPFRVNGPIFPDDNQSGDTADPKFFRLEPSQFTNGCFIARLSRQADPTKVETVQDVLARAAAKGLLGGIIPEQSKSVKKGKSKKNRAASAGSKPPSPSSRERQTGGESVNGQDPVAPLDHEEKKGECSEEEKEEDKRGKGGNKRRRHKRKVKRQPKQANRTTTVSKSQKKKPVKRKVNQTHHKRRLTKSKPRRIPRLTLTLISSAKPTKLSPITALAHKLSDNATIKSQQTAFSPLPAARPAPPTPHGASKQAQRQNTGPERAEKTLKGSAEPDSRSKARPKVVRLKREEVTLGTSKPADFTLPPISFTSASSLSGRSGSSLSQRPSRASNSQLAQISASSSSSSISLPGL